LMRLLAALDAAHAESARLRAENVQLQRANRRLVRYVRQLERPEESAMQNLADWHADAAVTR